MGVALARLNSDPDHVRYLPLQKKPHKTHLEDGDEQGSGRSGLLPVEYRCVNIKECLILSCESLAIIKRLWEVQL